MQVNPYKRAPHVVRPQNASSSGIYPGADLKRNVVAMRKLQATAKKAVQLARERGEAPDPQDELMALTDLPSSMLPSRQERKAICRKLGVAFVPVESYEGSSDSRWNV